MIAQIQIILCWRISKHPVISTEMKANRIEPPHTTQRLNNNVITINTLNNGNSKTMTVILLHVNSRKIVLKNLLIVSRKIITW